MIFEPIGDLLFISHNSIVESAKLNEMQNIFQWRDTECFLHLHFKTHKIDALNLLFGWL